FRTSSGIQTGESSNRESDEFIIHPNEIKSLKVGECIFSMKTEGILKRLRIPFPPKLPNKRRGGVLEREMPKSSTRRGRGVQRFENFDNITDAQGSLLEEVRKLENKQENLS
ncbi:MAG: hypothetical protein HY072_02520, partial [Deltaproteobacteria bacterium]|nr:hypothetical protein [Deltaproteobacteria bacterium]